MSKQNITYTCVYRFSEVLLWIMLQYGHVTKLAKQLFCLVTVLWGPSKQSLALSILQLKALKV